MDLNLNGLLNVFQSAPLIIILMVGVFTIAALVFNATENRTYQQERDTNLVLSILSGMLILSLMIVATQV